MRPTLRGLLPLAAALLAAATPAAPAAAQRAEALWYITDREEGVQSFLQHADRISIVAPQSFSLDSAGVVWGSVDARVMAAARAKGVKVVPLIVNPGFDQPMFHRVLVTPEIRARAVRNIAALCKQGGYDGIQFDFENIHISDRDHFTAFFRETADALHRVGCSASVAVVPRASDFPGPTPYHAWIYAYWRGAYDYRALADAGDFLSLMTYDQHTRRTPPGPIAGLPWMERVVQYVLAQGVPPQKLSLGIPSYSARWMPTYDAQQGARVWGSGIGYAQAMGLLARHGVQPVWDEKQKVSYALWENDGIHEFAYLEDARSFREKLELMRRYRLRGYSVWVLGMEDPAVWPMLGSDAAAR